MAEAKKPEQIIVVDCLTRHDWDYIRRMLSERVLDAGFLPLERLNQFFAKYDQPKPKEEEPVPKEDTVPSV